MRCKSRYDQFKQFERVQVNWRAGISKYQSHQERYRFKKSLGLVLIDVNTSLREYLLHLYNCLLLSLNATRLQIIYHFLPKQFNQRLRTKILVNLLLQHRQCSLLSLIFLVTLSEPTRLPCLIQELNHLILLQILQILLQLCILHLRVQRNEELLSFFSDDRGVVGQRHVDYIQELLRVLAFGSRGELGLFLEVLEELDAASPEVRVA